MPNFASLLKAEITRLARRELRIEIEPLKRSAANARSEIAALKKQLRSLQVELNQARKASKPEFDAPQFKFRAASLKSHRAKLGLSAKDYGLLLGASGLSVYKWEDGKATPRSGALLKIAAVRQMGKREALTALEKIKTEG